MRVETPSSSGSGISRARALLCAVGLSLLACSPGIVRAGIHVCPVAGGADQYQDRPCEAPAPPGTDTPEPAAPDTADRLVRAPAGIAPGWLARPERARYQAFCDRRGCECGSLERFFHDDLSIAVADALYIDGAWLRYESRVAAMDAATSSMARFAAHAELDDAACDLLMSQRTLHLFVEPTLERLRHEASDDSDKASLYRRMRLDLEMLREPRPVRSVTTR